MKIYSIVPKQHTQLHHALTDGSYDFLDSIVEHKRDYPYVDDEDVINLPKLASPGDKVNRHITNVARVSYRRHDLHTVDTLTSYDNQVMFRTFKFIPKKFFYASNVYRSYDPQSICITCNSDGSAKNAYICINATSSDSGDYQFSDPHNGEHVVQFIRIKMDNGEPVASVNPDDFLAGPPIDLEHGQSNTINTNNELIALGEYGGTSPVGGICKIDKSDLSPSRYGELNFNLGRSDKEKKWGKQGYRLGNDFCALSDGSYLNVCPNTKGNSPLVPQYSLKLYRIYFDYANGIHIHAVHQYIRNAGGVTIQGIAENPYSKRVTVLYDNGMISFPEAKIGHLDPDDIKQVIFNGYRESEGIAYDNNGIAYLLTDRYPEILVSRDLKDF